MLETYARSVRNLRGVIFDLDGTLVDSRLDFAALRQTLACPQDMGVLEYVAALPDTQRVAAEQAVLEFEQAGARQASWMPGARACLRTLRQWQVPVAILTRNAGSVARYTLERLDVEVDLLLAREDCPPKPAPDGLLMIAGHWRAPVHQCVYVGDYLFDLQAARSAGMISCYYDPAACGDFADLADWHICHLDQLYAAHP